MASRRRPSHRPRSWSVGNGPIAIRVGSKRAARRFHEMMVVGPQDAGRFSRFIQDHTRAYPDEPLILAINGYQPWLGEVLNVCVQDSWSDISDLDREVQFARTMQFPERESRRGECVPWTFIVDHMNVPQVYYWSCGLAAPDTDDYGLPSVNRFRFRVGVWQMRRGACTFDRKIAVTIIFTQPTEVGEHVVTGILFPYLYRDGDFRPPRHDEQAICWVFSQLYELLSDWQNVLAEIAVRLKEAEVNSHGSRVPVKLRARMMHIEVDRIYEMKDFLHFHSRAFKKLQKLKDAVPAAEQSEPLWTDMDDAVEDLDQFDGGLDSLKERFNNLIELEFNIQNAVQADNGQFLSMVATLFLPVSFLASIWGFTTITWHPLWYVYAAVPVFVLSVAFTVLWPLTVRHVQRALYPVDSLRIPLEPRQFTMLGDELPDGVNAPGSAKAGAGGGSGARARRKPMKAAQVSSDGDEPVRGGSRPRRRSDNKEDYR